MAVMDAALLRFEAGAVIDYFGFKILVVRYLYSFQSQIDRKQVSTLVTCGGYGEAGNQ